VDSAAGIVINGTANIGYINLYAIPGKNLPMEQILRKSLNRLLYSTVRTLHHQMSIGTSTAENSQMHSSTEIISKLQELRFEKPILNHRDVIDYGSTGFVADPFLFCDSDGIYHLFFEVFSPQITPTASIGHAISQDSGVSWRYDRIVFQTDRHVSFPFVFSKGGQVYLLPDLSNKGERYSPARLYRSTDFPVGWEPVADIINADHKCLDTVLFEHDGLWWAIMGGGNNDEIRVYFSEVLTAVEWVPHPENPVVTDRCEAGRPAGRPVVSDNSIIVFYQDCRKEYGSAVNAYELVQLSQTTYEDRKLTEKPVLSGVGGIAWNSGRMHHVDMQTVDDTLLIAVDGDVGWGRNQYTGSLWSIGFESVDITVDE